MSARQLKLEFPGHDTNPLAGLLSIPSGRVTAFALLAHCFTCGKDTAAATRISRALVNRGFGVLRFDFTGLGSSDGDFANTNFSSNVQDLIAAANYLREKYQAPALLVGHSLGGAAVLKAAHDIPESVGVVTIGAPADPRHVASQFAADLGRIQTEGTATVNLAGRVFTMKKQFLDDLAVQDAAHIGELRKALLVMHASRDEIVSINEAEKIYKAARHPKSFIGLDEADHLLTGKEDAEYVAEIIATWSGRYIPIAAGAQPGDDAIGKGHVRVREKDHRFTCEVKTDVHAWLADEPRIHGGKDLGPDPYEHLLAALGACTAMTVRMYADRKHLPLDDVSVEIIHRRDHGEDCQACDENHPAIDLIERKIALQGELTPEQKTRILKIADRCPVHRTLHNKLVVKTDEVEQL